MRDNIIDIAVCIGRDLKSRIAVKNLYDMIQNQNLKDVKIDLRNVNFATRSFMDEFYNVFIANADLNVELINLSPELKAMIDAVKSTQHRSTKSALKISSDSDIKFSSISQVNKYLDELSFN
jgi:hypothetical protein